MTNFSSIVVPSTPHSASKKGAMTAMLCTPRISNTAKRLGKNAQPKQIDSDFHMPISPSTEVVMNNKSGSYRYISQRKVVAPCGFRPKREEPEDSPRGDPVIATFPMSPSSQAKQILYRRWFPKCNEIAAASTAERGAFPKSPIARCRRLLFGTNETATYQSNEPSKNILLTSDRWSTCTESLIVRPPKQPQRQGSCRHLTNESSDPTT